MGSLVHAHFLPRFSPYILFTYLRVVMLWDTFDSLSLVEIAFLWGPLKTFTDTVAHKSHIGFIWAMMGMWALLAQFLPRYILLHVLFNTIITFCKLTFGSNLVSARPYEESPEPIYPDYPCSSHMGPILATGAFYPDSLLFANILPRYYFILCLRVIT